MTASAAIHLSSRRRRQLAGLRASTLDPRLFLRLSIILMAAAGTRVTEIARRFQISRTTVRSWCQRWQRNGLAGLRDRARPGRPRKATSRFVHRLLRLVRRHPPGAGHNGARWSMARLSRHMHRVTGICVGQERIRQILRDHHPIAGPFPPLRVAPRNGDRFASQRGA